MGMNVAQRTPGCSRSFLTFFCIQMDFQDPLVIPRPTLTQTISLGTPSAGSIINTTSEVVTLCHTPSGCKEVSLFSQSGSQSRMGHRLWRSQTPTPTGQQTDITLTAVLPLEFDSLLFGYSEFRDFPLSA